MTQFPPSPNATQKSLALSQFKRVPAPQQAALIAAFAVHLTHDLYAALHNGLLDDAHGRDAIQHASQVMVGVTEVLSEFFVGHLVDADHALRILTGTDDGILKVLCWQSLCRAADELLFDQHHPRQCH